MAKLQLWVVYHLPSEVTFLVRGKKYATRVANLVNKSYQLLKLTSLMRCEPALTFYSTHSFNKDKIHFCWEVTQLEKMNIHRELIKAQRGDI